MNIIDIRQFATQIVGFLLVLWILGKYAWPPVLNFIEERANVIFLGGADFTGATFEFAGLDPAFRFSESLGADGLMLTTQSDGGLTATPEPGTLSLILIGLSVVWAAYRRRNSRAAIPLETAA